MANFGIKETQDVFRAGIALKDAIKISRQDDGKITFPGDLINFIGFLTVLPAAFSGIENVPNELNDLDDEEIVVLSDMFGEIINDTDYQRVFFGLVIAGTAINEIIKRDDETREGVVATVTIPEGPEPEGEVTK